jgi:hypothetical protein
MVAENSIYPCPWRLFVFVFICERICDGPKADKVTQMSDESVVYR